MASTQKIAFISAMTRVPWGGSEELWAGTALSLKGVGCDVCAAVKDHHSPVKKIENLSKKGIQIFHHHPLGLFGDKWCRLRERIFPPLPRYHRLIQWLKREGPDLVCVSGGNFKDGLWALEILYKLSLPYVIVVQANVEWLWPGDVEREKLCHVYKNAKAVFCVSQGNLDLLQDQLALKLPQAEVIRNPFNLKWEQENIWPAQEPILKLACVGRLEPDAKGQDLIINSLSRPEWKNRSVEVSFFGEGKSSEGLKQLVENADLSHMIHFHGQVQDIENIWNEHHALLLPSRYEGLPLALIEAMLCGRPAVVTDVAGHTELVTDGIEGIVAVAANQKCWNAAMDKLWNQRSELQRMGLNARTRARMEIPKDPCDEFRKRLLEMIQC